MRSLSTFVFLDFPICQRASDYHSHSSELIDSLVLVYPFVLVENNGFEPLTPCVQSRCSSQLS